MLSIEKYAEVNATVNAGLQAYQKACDVVRGLDKTNGWVRPTEVYQEVQNLPRRVEYPSCQSVTVVLNKLAECGEVEKIRPVIEQIATLPDGSTINLGPRMRRAKGAREQTPATVSLYRKKEEDKNW